MSDDRDVPADGDSRSVHGASDGVTAGTHSAPGPLCVFAAPSTGEEFNRVRAAIFPIACFKLESMRFDFESSVVLPELRREMPILAQLLADHTEPDNLKRTPPLSIFGHADPVGDDDLNKALSGRRAAAIYGLVTRRVEVWEDLYKTGSTGGAGKFVRAAAGDVWGIRSIQIVLNALPPDHFAPSSAASSGVPSQASGAPPIQQPPLRPLELTGQLDSATRDRVRSFQAGPKGAADGLATDGDPGAATRKTLFLAYMEFICVDSRNIPFKIDARTGFLAENADPEGKGDFQGCSEFNPVLLFSKSAKAKFDVDQNKTGRNASNASNRRVMVLLFRPGAKITAQLWPCPRSKEGTAGCRKRFWSDGEKRRSNSDEERRFDKTHDTFACRFYQRLLTNSPCESVLALVRIRLFDDTAAPLPFAPCVVTEPGKTPRPDRASGVVDSQSAFITIKNLKVPAVVNLKWNRPGASDNAESPLPALTDEFEFEMNVAVDIPDDTSDEPSLTRLTNMGYVRGPTRSDDIREFQRDYKPRFADIQVDGTLNTPTRNAIREVHDNCDPVRKGRPAGGPTT